MTPEEIRDALIKPFDPADLKFFPAATSQDKKKGKVATYADTRAYMERLDAVVPGGWATSYRTLDPITLAVECTLSVNFDGVWVARTDVGYPNEAKDADNANKEPYKAAYSDALKRAAVQHGIGRFIYSLELERDWLPIDEWGKFTEQPRIKGTQARSPSVPARPTPTPTEPTPSTPPSDIGVWWAQTRKDKLERQDVIATAVEMFAREPAGCTPEERQQIYERLMSRQPALAT